LIGGREVADVPPETNSSATTSELEHRELEEELGDGETLLEGIGASVDFSKRASDTFCDASSSIRMTRV
jgi:hypothetical protein